MSDVHDMSDRELNVLIDAEVMCDMPSWPMAAPRYTTNAFQTERVMARMERDDRYSLVLRREDTEGYWASFRISGRFYGWSECSNWKRAVCEAALLAVRHEHQLFGITE